MCKSSSYVEAVLPTMVIKTFTILEFDNPECIMYSVIIPIGRTNKADIILIRDRTICQNYRGDHRGDVPVTSAFPDRGNNGRIYYISLRGYQSADRSVIIA